jgi:glutamate carboxypeptidase
MQRAMQAWMPDFEADLAWMAGHDRGFMDKAGVDAAVDWMQARLQALGCQTQRFASRETGDTISGTLRGRGRGRYLLIAHLDTVWAPGTAAGWPLRIENGRAYGPGVVDNGAGSLAGCYTLRLLRELAGDSFASITLVCNGDEESGSLFSGSIITELAHGCDAALCLEAPPSPGQIVSRRGGSMGIDLRVTGQRAHTQVEPEKGANAILELSHKVIAAHEIVSRDGRSLVCVVTTEGGPQSGTVPDTARAEFDVRLTSPEDAAHVEACFEQLASRQWVPGTSTSFSSRIYHPPMERLPGADQLVALAQQLGLALGRPLSEAHCDGVADGCFATLAGVPTLCGMAPHGGDYHRRGEWLDLGTVAERVALAAGLVSAEPSA